ncbi:MAG: hypothetical protein KKB20_28380 [Proteobacteria bacterium]|nr:hypothetical protein [Pseudomonadota bacterium]
MEIRSKVSNGNLHVHPQGDLTAESAESLARFIHEMDDGQGRVFVETRGMNQVNPSGCLTLRSRLEAGGVSAQRLFFKGEKGFDMAPPGARVLVGPMLRCRCRGDRSRCRAR